MRVMVGGRELRLECREADGRWKVQAFRVDNGDPFGVEVVADSERDAVDRLTRWIEWQAAHADALAELQAAERAYHRTIAGSAFASPTEGPSAIEVQKESLAAVERARVRLDDLRARRPPDN